MPKNFTHSFRSTINRVAQNNGATTQRRKSAGFEGLILGNENISVEHSLQTARPFWTAVLMRIKIQLFLKFQMLIKKIIINLIKYFEIHLGF